MNFIPLLISAFAITASIAHGDESGACSLPLANGPCRAKIPRFYFDARAGRCQLFFYTGCGANENHFSTLAECHSTCGNGEATVKHLRGTHCLLPHTKGDGITCRGAFPKYTFNSRTLTCERILYGGCGGTQNLFSSREECVSSCLHQAVTPNMMSSRGRGASSKDVLFNGHPKDTPVCSLPPVLPGTMACRAFVNKWTFDSKQGKCVEYIYGGCRGTANLFDSNEECENKCIQKQSEKKSRPELCSLPSMRPDVKYACRARLPRYTFDSNIGKCRAFIYGGCGATENIFTTKAACEQTCDNQRYLETEKKTLNVCQQPLETGPCRAMMPKYGYNQDSRRCQLFTYGGCQGNENSFDTVEDCVNTCGGELPSAEPICSEVKCDPKEALLYKAKGCSPVLKPGECCPSQWECSSWEERLRRKGECFMASKAFPQGRYYAIGDMIDEARDVCEVGCFCSRAGDEAARIVCAVMDCAMPMPHESGARKTCKKFYSAVNDCCPSEIRCEGDDEPLAPSIDDAAVAPPFTCQFGSNQTVAEGETFYPEPANPCRRCLCRPGWEGDLADELCHDQHCFVQQDAKMQRGCQPIYHPRGCCPIDWVCPKTPTLNPDVPEPEEEEDDDDDDDTIDADATLVRITSMEELETASDVCLLPKPDSSNSIEEGVEASTSKFYFDMDNRRCKEFIQVSPPLEEYSGKRNSFDSIAECVKTCDKFKVITALVPECESAAEDDARPRNSDRCLPARKFRFNKSSGKCENFVQYGCGGNVNSFASLDECEAKCAQEPEMAEDQEQENLQQHYQGKKLECNLPVEPGMCRARMKRFYFDKTSGICKQFWYGGCQGNQNNFIEERECIAQCVPEERLTRALEGQQLDLVGSSSPCSQQPDAGPCRAKSPKFYFDPETFTCRLFFYGGCAGNKNRFDSLAECSATCPVNNEAMTAATARCALPSVVGDCRAAIPRWHYDQEIGSCRRFLYSGCGANENNFETREECLTGCGLLLREISTSNLKILPLEDTFPLDSSACLLEKSSGVCKGRFRRFFFNKESNACEPFFFSGCQANANNFKSLSECQSRCSPSSAPSKSSAAMRSDAVRHPTCLLSPEVGECRAQRPMWYYDSQTRKCQRFFWGGCRGNANKFRTEAECLSKCGDPAPEAWEQEKQYLDRLPEGVVEMARESYLLEKPSEPKCVMGNETYHRGDTIRFPHDQCKVCVCATPPSLSCGVVPCPSIGFIPQPGKVCTPVMDKYGCCQVGLHCVDPPKEEPKDVCSGKACPAIGFVPQQGKKCRPKMDSDGCCQIGLNCISVEAPQSEIDVCQHRPCPLLGFLPTAGESNCEPVMDRDGCCQVGVNCVSLDSPSAPSVDKCAGAVCPALAFLPQDGKLCRPKMDQDNCCQIGLDCVEQESESDPEADPCARKPCPLIAFLPQPEKTCEKIMDADDCCQVGLKCF